MGPDGLKLPRYANRRGDSSSSARRRRRRPAREGSRSIRPLQAWRKRLAELVLKAGIGWHQDALVFPGLRSGSVVQPYEPDVVSGIVSRLARKAEMPANIAPLHGLRHRHASSLMSLPLRLGWWPTAWATRRCGSPLISTSTAMTLTLARQPMRRSALWSQACANRNGRRNSGGTQADHPRLWRPWVGWLGWLRCVCYQRLALASHI